MSKIHIGNANKDFLLNKGTINKPQYPISLFKKIIVIKNKSDKTNKFSLFFSKQ